MYISETGRWMAASRLKLNVDKTKVVWLGTDGLLRKVVASDASMNIGSCTVMPSDIVRLLGVKISSDLTLWKHVSAVSAGCFY